MNNVTGWILGLLVLLSALSAGPIPANKPANYPDWWFERDVIPRLDPNNASPVWPDDYPQADDYAVVNQGQVKNIAKQAYAEISAKVSGGAGSALDGQWGAPAASTDDYAAINLGQLKNVAEPFYARLGELGYSGQPLSSGQHRPWLGQADDFALANIGQVKNVFSFIPVLVAGGVDAEPPSIPVMLPVSGLSSRNVVINWEPSTDNVGVVGYEIYENGELITTTALLSYEFQYLAPGSLYSFKLKAFDGAANKSAACDALLVATPGLPYGTFTLSADEYAADEDGDGMPNGWELEHGLNPFDPSDAALVTGGLTNLEIYQASLGIGADPSADTPVGLLTYTP